MTEEKQTMLLVILKYLFKDDQTKLGNEQNEFKVEFTRPIGTSIYNRYLIAWNESGDFRILGIVGKERPLPIAVSDWFQVGSYLKNNYVKARQHLKITKI